MDRTGVATGYAEVENTEELSKEVEVLASLVSKALALVGAENRPAETLKALPTTDKVEVLTEKVRSMNADIRHLHSVLAKI